MSKNSTSSSLDLVKNLEGYDPPISSINGDTTSNQLITAGTSISVSTSGGNTVITNTAPGAGGVLPIANGGTAKTSVTTVAAASSWAGWDTNSNLSANNYLSSFVIINTGVTYNATVASPRNILNTNNTGFTFVLPDPATRRVTKYYSFRFRYQ